MSVPPESVSVTDNPERYRWVIIAAGICGLFASLGIGRFALGMLLPAMGAALELSYSQMGVISTINFGGYLGAVLLCGKLVGRWGSRLVISCALALVGGSMLLIGVSSHFYLISILYFLTGAGSAISNIPIMALVAAWFGPALRGRASGMVVIGNGLGIVMAGNLVPILNRSEFGWRLGWLVLGATALSMAMICWLLIRDRAAGGRPAKGRAVSVGGDKSRPSVWRGPEAKIFLRCAALYFIFGSTYVIFATFFVTSLIEERGFTEQAAGALWSWVGVLSLGSGPIFGALSDRFGRRTGLISVFCIQATAYVSAMAILPTAFLTLSIICYGIVAWSVPSIIAALVGDWAGPERTASVFGMVTFAMGIGQILGPYCAGLLAEATGSFSFGFLTAGMMVLVAVLVSATLPGPKAIKKQ